MAGKKKAEADLSTEEKIKEAASRVFTRKGYAATRTRDIAEEAGINLALLNYYFRSKEKLFQQIMAERMQQLFGVIAPILNNAALALEAKIDRIAEQYIDMLLIYPDLPLFVLSEIRNNPEQFVSKMNLKTLIVNSSYMKQLQERRPDIHPIHFLLNTLGLIVFPFVAQPVLEATGIASPAVFRNVLAERKKLIPAWLKMMLEAS